jgi:polysaccharide pyruvyl transferase WcaK-like protein
VGRPRNQARFHTSNPGVPLGIVDFIKTFPDDERRNIEAMTSDRPIAIGLLGASFGAKNLGVAALACGTVASVFYSYPNARLFIVDYAIEPATYQVKHPGGIASIELVNIRFSKRFYLHNNIAYLLFLALCLRLLPSRKWRERLLLRNRVLKAIHEADIIGSIAGGDSFSDIYGLRRLIYMALPQILVLQLKKPLVLLPQTFGPFKGTFAKAIARYILKRSKIVYSRDSGGFEAVRDLIGRDRGRLEFSYDMGFALDPNIRTERIPFWMSEYDKSIPLVGVNVSGLLSIGGYTRNNMFNIKGDYHQLIHKLINYFIQTYRAHVMLVPHVFGTDDESESDVIACRRVHDDIDDRLRNYVHLIRGEFNQYEIKALIGRCDFFVGSRMHACIAAISQCVPAVGLAYSRKFQGVFDSVGMEELVIDIREHDEDAIMAFLERAYQRRQELRAKLEANIPAVQASVLSLFSRLSIDPEQ